MCIRDSDLAAWAWAAVGKQAALKLMPEATEHFQRAALRASREGAEPDWPDDTLAWKVRAALRDDLEKLASFYEVHRDVVALDPKYYRADDVAEARRWRCSRRWRPARPPGRTTTRCWRSTYSAEVERATSRYEAVTWKLNGGTFFGCQGGPEAAGCVIDRHCSAAPGDVPCWGQAGQFLVEVEGLRALVDFGGGVGVMGSHFEFNAVDLDKPFISETGYRSHFDTAQGCMTVDEVARGILAAQRAEKKRPVMVEASLESRQYFDIV